MSVYDNMAFGLKLRKYDKAEIKKRVDEAAEILGLDEYLDRKPGELSGGQRQRVAMGRAMVRDAKVFLMDEPLSNLDAKLRVSMRAEIAKLHRRIGSTTVYVTHDQTEAMTLADRIVIMSKGMIQQVGTPQDLYNHPANLFVAGFIGSPAMNFIEATYQNGFVESECGLKLKVPEWRAKVLSSLGYNGKEITVGIRPEDIKSEEIVIQTFPESIVKSTVVVSELLGADTMIYSKVGNREFVSKVDARDYKKPGEEITLAFDMNNAHLFDKETQENVLLAATKEA
jgi:multiple sugar transport system ATP-binding protein